jgi:hypothetical protein
MVYHVTLHVEHREALVVNEVRIGDRHHALDDLALGAVAAIRILENSRERRGAQLKSSAA